MMRQRIYLEYKGKTVEFDSFTEAQAEYHRLLQEEGTEAKITYERP